MSVNTNRWNRIRYTFYAPFYNSIAGLFRKSRQKSIRLLNIQPGEKVLLIGAGTGLDFDFLPKNAHITATDLTPAMVTKMEARAAALGLPATCLVMDGHQLTFPDSSFDKIILHLIVAVIPDPEKCLQEAERVLKPDGAIVVFDKFLPAAVELSWFRKLLNRLTNFLFSDVTRKIETLVDKTNLEIIADQKANFGGNFRIILLKRSAGKAEPKRF